MARSLLQSFVNGTRQMLAAQLFISVGIVALAGWTLAITDQVISERDALRDRVVQLEQTMAARGEIPPEPPTVVTSAGLGPYPGSIREGYSVEAATAPNAAPATEENGEDIGDVIGDFFAPAPPISTIVIHIRSEADRDAGELVAQALAAEGDERIIVRLMQQGDATPPGYVYFDGRQSRAAAQLMDRFHNLSRDNRIAAWTAQLQGVALPARGEYVASRLDIVLPPLPPPLTAGVPPALR